MEVLHRRVRLLWGLRYLVLVAVVTGVAAVATVFFGGPVELVAPAVVVLGLLVVVPFVFALYRSWGFDLEPDALYLERGVITLVETAVPYVRVQHVDTQRGPIERSLGLASVVVYTAGSRGADVTIPGLRPERARDLRNELRDLAIESEPEDAV